MKSGFALTLLVCGLGGCASGPPSPQRACEDQANHDPNISYMQDEVLGDPSMTEELQGRIRSARRQFIDDCLARMGDGTPGGGVESPIRQ
jgi:hypothetical protein